MKEKILVTDVAKFSWQVTWAQGTKRQIAISHVRGYHALRPKRSLPLPEGWATALRALQNDANADVARRCQSQLSPDISDLNCLLVGLPKHVVPADVGASVGARVLLSDNDRPVQFVLLANIKGNLWYCHAGGDIFSGTSPWNWDRAISKDIVADV